MLASAFRVFDINSSISITCLLPRDLGLKDSNSLVPVLIRVSCIATFVRRHNKPCCQRGLASMDAGLSARLFLLSGTIFQQ
jgi:hypothetical protein